MYSLSMVSLWYLTFNVWDGIVGARIFIFNALKEIKLLHCIIISIKSMNPYSSFKSKSRNTVTHCVFTELITFIPLLNLFIFKSPSFVQGRTINNAKQQAFKHEILKINHQFCFMNSRDWIYVNQETVTGNKYYIFDILYRTWRHFTVFATN